MMRKLINIIEAHLDALPGINAQLDALIADAEAAGFRLELSFDGDFITLEWIARRANQKGSGANVMNELCRIADQHAIPIELYAFAADPGLMAYYERFGFVEDPSKGDEAWMIRNPK